jgi:hypothetical protein
MPRAPQEAPVSGPYVASPSALGTAPKIFTPDEYKAIIRCLHPDANPPTASQK